MRLGRRREIKHQDTVSVWPTKPNIAVHNAKVVVIRGGHQQLPAKVRPRAAPFKAPLEPSFDNAIRMTLPGWAIV